MGADLACNVESKSVDAWRIPVRQGQSPQSVANDVLLRLRRNHWLTSLAALGRESPRIIFKRLNHQSGNHHRAEQIDHAERTFL